MTLSWFIKKFPNQDALRFCALTGGRPMVEVFPLEQAALAFEKMMSAKVHFRAVLKMGGR
jgi:alcohol dehydrogenase, propanol-preferring